MTIKNAKQNGPMISVSYDSASTSIQGELIGFTPNAIFVKYGNHLNVYKQKSGSGIGGCGTNITINPSEEIKMYGNCAGVKRNGRIYLYDENGKPAGTRNA